MIKLKDYECWNCETVNVVDTSETMFECSSCNMYVDPEDCVEITNDMEEEKLMNNQVKQQ